MGAILTVGLGISDGKQIERNEISEEVCMNVACEPMPGEWNGIIE